MKKAPLYFLAALLTLNGCKEECTQPTANDFSGTYQNGSGVLMLIEPINENRFRIDGNFSATVLECGNFDVVEQTYQHPFESYSVTVSGSGQMQEPENTINNGQIVPGQSRVKVSLTYQFNGQTVTDNSIYNRQ